MTSVRARLLAKISLATCLFLVAPAAQISSAQQTTVAPLTADQVVQRMVEKNEQRAQALESYRGTRVYHLEYHGLGSRTADLVVSMTYRRPDEKKFCILSETGSDLLRGRVLKKLLEAEIEAMQADQRRQREMGPENYEFKLVANGRTSYQEFYVLEVIPRIKNKFLFRGKIWVEAKDFAVARMEGEPAKNPSWWTKRNLIHVTYEKVGEFWLPARNETNTQVRIVGRSLLTITYKDYEITAERDARLASSAKASSAEGCSAPREPAKLSASQP